MTQRPATTWIALGANIALCGIGTWSATLWTAPQERLATGMLGVVGLLLTGLVAFDLRRPQSNLQWHWKPAVLGVAASALLLAGALATRPIRIIHDPQTTQIKVAGRVVSHPDEPVYRARVWPDDAETPVVVELKERTCQIPPAFARVQEILDEHHGTWEPLVACPLE